MMTALPIPSCLWRSIHAKFLTLSTETGNLVLSRNPYDLIAVILLVRLEGFEPPTLGSVDRCSNPLSYSRIVTGGPS